MFDFLKKIFKKKSISKKEYIGITKIGFDFFQWKQNILQKENFDLVFLNDLEILFIKSDINVSTASHLIEQIKNQIKIKNITKTYDFLLLVKEVLVSFYSKNYHLVDKKNENLYNNKNKVFLFVGVNGVGKTTTIGKLAFKLKKKGHKVLLVAGDTFRIGAVEQLKKWGQKINVEVFYKYGNKDRNISASSLFFEALLYAKTKNFDSILCDTSGRLENKINLMKELEKIQKVINKQMPGAPHETFLILDAMTGQNGLKQVKLFNQVVCITNIILTKFDGISKGGIIFTIKNLYNLSVKYIGNGEQVDDLITFSIENYVNSLFGN
ncbi:MAG: signal recognition particle-docking protein FtsY [Candidatus Phytoplasma stylosanthis]|uniref:signal recognition particle-docking protein FtsY n=1 Tax=Candidatus Phytoplasma stylosanthis TaxID=2798314 RepID=UPI002939864D|nr:signal recognition particle-docking protein FtsY [Candidatus Phytoplasma stylosanthis]MDV3167922.1 signal recognition particle-docking protein FtsY [Candidatus Phytoplasma stylosanthis]MDV3170757.1 signal recognition particle-docking protein FtsY [Candidatus Phytoplasma stylosanthis]MDV3173724.1 signal recognition particle-docking protein FtsY [Candidatus Phytoplasma stylosanthis]MDV3174014.1 signal recognition particle-docking protein FtsY [Candidatus Phytoplasma stylosanthis]MDV3202574.1 